jgi:hypothetical protein
VIPDLRVLKGTKGLLVFRAHKVRKDIKDSKVILETEDSRDFKVILDLKDPKDSKAILVSKAKLDHKDHKGSKEILGHLDLPEYFHRISYTYTLKLLKLFY